MAQVPTSHLTAIIVPISLLIIVIIGFTYRRRNKNRCTREEKPDDASSGEYSTPYAFEDYETPYANDIYEEYQVITDGSNNNPRQKSPISQSPIQSIKNIYRQDTFQYIFDDFDSIPDFPNSSSDDHNQEREEECPIEKPDAFLPGYIYQLKKAGRFDNVQEVLKENEYPPDYPPEYPLVAASGMCHTEIRYALFVHSHCSLSYCL